MLAAAAPQVYQQMEKVSDRARKAGIELDRVQPERTIGWEAKRLFGGDEEAAAASRGAKELFAERMEEAGGCGARVHGSLAALSRKPDF